MHSAGIHDQWTLEVSLPLWNILIRLKIYAHESLVTCQFANGPLPVAKAQSIYTGPISTTLLILYSADLELKLN